nr:hypothetical protein [Tanacetum cinerariifolium]
MVEMSGGMEARVREMEADDGGGFRGGGGCGGSFGGGGGAWWRVKNGSKVADGYVNHESQKIPKEDWKERSMISTSGEVRARILFVLSSSNKERLLRIIDLMIQKNKRMKQKGLKSGRWNSTKDEDSGRSP